MGIFDDVLSVVTNPVGSLTSTLSSLGIPLPPGVTYLANGVTISGNYITSAAGKTFPVSSLGVRYVIDKTGNVLDIAGEGTSFLVDHATNEVFNGFDQVMSYSGMPVRALDLLPGGQFYEVFQQLSGIGSIYNQIALSLNSIVGGVNSISNEISDWL
jgi:hypothetical protein